MKRLLAGILLLTVSGPVLAQEASLIDLLQTKGVLSKKDVQKLKKGKGEKATYDQQALIMLLRSKGVLEDKDLAQLQTPMTPAAPAVVAAPEINERLSRVESQQQALQAQTQAQA